MNNFQLNILFKIDNGYGLTKRGNRVRLHLSQNALGTPNGFILFISRRQIFFLFTNTAIYFNNIMYLISIFCKSDD